MHYRFGAYTLDTQRYELHHAGQRVPLRPKVFHVLAYLLAQRDRVVSKDEVMTQVWPGQVISEETLSSCITAARRAVGDSGQQQAVIQTRHGHGYRFVAAVEVGDPPPLVAAAPAGALAASTLPELEHADSATPPGSLAPSHQFLSHALAGEHKVVTVLVGTLAPGTPGTQRQVAESWHQALQAVFGGILEEIERYGGTLQSVRDDGFLALFGAPVAQEDHARRAVRAALEVLQRLRPGPGAPAGPLGEADSVRLGLHPGPILLGRLGAEQRLTYTAVGDTLRHATWLAQQAAPGTILVSAATAPLVHGEVRLTVGAPGPLAGQTDAGLVYQVCGLGSRPAPLLPDGTRPRSRFVGRELELTTLQALLTRVIEGQGQVVGIVGEPGMGKTRLLAECWQRLGDTPVTWLEGRCVSYGQATPYLPLCDLLRQACGLTEVDSPAVITATMQQYLQALGLAPDAAAPILLPLLGVSDGAAARVGRSPQEIRLQTFATLHQLLRHESQRQPLVVVLENLHWIDPTSQAYLVEAVEQLTDAPLLLLVTFRPGYRPPWMDKSYATQLALSRLSPAESRGVVQAVLHPTPVPEPLMQGMLAKAAGNPLFLEELAWTVREHGNLRLPPEVPDTVQAVLTARVDRLPPEEKRLLQTAAVVGTEVRLSLLQALIALPEEALGQSLHHLQSAEFLYATRPAPEPTYAFKHVLTQEAAYQSLLKHTRQQVHRQIAQVLEAQFPMTAETQPEVLAQHYTEAGLSTLALPYWERAGWRANERSAHVEAIAHLTKGLALLPTLPDTPARDRHELALRVALSGPLNIVKGFASPDVEPNATRAWELCQQSGDTRQLRQVLWTLTSFYNTHGPLLAGREMGEQLLHLAQGQQDPFSLLTARSRLGQALVPLGELPLARRHLEQGLALYNLQSPSISPYPPDPRLACCAYAAFALWGLGYPGQALALSQEMLTLARELEQPFGLAQALYHAAQLLYYRREAQVVQELLAEQDALLTSQEFAFQRARGTLLRGWSFALQGQGAAGIAWIHQGLAAYRGIGVELRPTHLSLLAEAYSEVGQIDEGLRVLSEALAGVAATGERFWEAEVYRLQGELLLTSKRRSLASAAEACFHQALDVARSQSAKSLELRATMSLSRLWQHQGQRAAACELLAPLYGWFTEGFDTADLHEARVLLEELG